jgi:hypothetical protein
MKYAYISGGLGVPSSNLGAPTTKSISYMLRCVGRCIPHEVAWVHDGYICFKNQVARNARLRRVVESHCAAGRGRADVESRCRSRRRLRADRSKMG